MCLLLLFSSPSAKELTNETNNLGTYPIQSSLAMKLTPLLPKSIEKCQDWKSENCRANEKLVNNSCVVQELPKMQNLNVTTEKQSTDIEKEKDAILSFSTDDIEMLTEACKELESSPPSPVSPSNGFVVEPDVSNVCPLTELKQITIVPYNIAVSGPKRQLSRSVMKLKDSISTKTKKPVQSKFNNENSATVSRSSTGASCNMKGFEAFQSKWPRTKLNQKLQLTSYRKNALKRICSDLNQKPYLTLTNPLPQLPQYHMKAITDGPFYPELADNAPDLDVFSSSSDLSDIFPELDMLSNCST